jgi:hypothetical protein
MPELVKAVTVGIRQGFSQNGKMTGQVPSIGALGPSYALA